MSDSQINVTITATDSGLNAAMQNASAAVERMRASVRGMVSDARAGAPDFKALIDNTTGIDRAARSAADSAETFRKALGDQTNEVKALRAAMSSAKADTDSSAESMHRLGGATSGVTREITVIAHEMISGRFSRIPGSLMVLTQYMGGVSTATLVMAGSFAAATLAAVHLVEWINKIGDARAGVEAAGAFFNPQLNQAALDKLVMNFRTLREVSTEDAKEVVATFARMSGATVPLIQALSNETLRYAEATGDKLPQAAKVLEAAFASPTSRGEEFLRSMNANEAVIKTFNEAVGDDGPLRKREIMLNALDAATQRVGKTTANSLKASLEAGMAATDPSSVGIIGLDPTAYERAEALNKEHLNKLSSDHRAAILSMNNIEKQTSKQTPTWFENQQEGADELKARVIGAATDYKQANLNAAKALTDFWREAEGQAQKGSRDQQKAHEQYLRYKEQADLLSLKIDQHNAQEGFLAQIEALTAMQHANKDNFDYVMRLEDQKLALLAQHYGENSKEYQRELAHQADLQSQHNQQLLRMAEEDLRTREQTDQMALQSKVKSLNAQVAAHQISKDEAINILREFVTANEKAELEMVDNLEKSLAKGTTAFQHAEDQKILIKQRTEKTLADLDSQAAMSSAKADQKELESAINMFSNIGHQGSTTLAGLISGTTTWQQAESRIFQSVLSDFLGFTEHIIGRWIATELAKSTISTTQNAVRAAQERGDTGLGTLISLTLSKWLGLETSKTGISLGQSAARTGAEEAATTTQAATDATSAAATEAIKTTSAISQINAAAGVAAANAFAATAAIPIIGPELAPGAAAAALAAVEAFQSFAVLDVGTPNVPHDMMAIIHRGEMVVPADFASGIRSGQISLGGDQNSSASFSYAPTIHAGGSNMSSIDALLRKHGQEMFRYIQNVTRNGAIGLPGRPARG